MSATTSKTVTTKTMVKSLRGEKLGEASLDAAFLDGANRPAVLRHAVEMYEANLRVGTADTLTRAEVQGSTKKLYKQKHTGRARHGDKKAPSFRKGGIAHGPHPRDYRQVMPRRALKQALRVALAKKLASEQVLAWEQAALAKPSTKAVAHALEQLGAVGGALIVAGGAVDKNLLLSVRNLPRVTALPASAVTAHDVVAHRWTVLLDGAMDGLRARLESAVSRRTAEGKVS
jgi:large subunit ribosomal protein L4